MTPSELPDGKPVCDLHLAVNDRRGDHDPLFIDLAACGREAKSCAEYLRKGKQIALTGGPTRGLTRLERSFAATLAV